MRKPLGLAANALYGFSAHQPVFWRLLILQSRLYTGLLRTRAGTLEKPSTPETLLRLFEPGRDFPFPHDTSHPSELLFEPLATSVAVSTAYLRTIIIPSVLPQL